MSGAFLRRRDRTDRPLRVDHYSAAVNTYVLELGRVALEGTGKSISDDPGVRRAYLGL